MNGEHFALLKLLPIFICKGREDAAQLVKMVGSQIRQRLIPVRALRRIVLQQRAEVRVAVYPVIIVQLKQLADLPQLCCGRDYLDENSGERWCLNAKDGWFGCGKIIGSCYYSTIAAVHVLTTLWSTSYAATLINGCLVREKTYIRWINYVLGTQYTNQRASQLWEIGKLLQLDDDYWGHRNPA